MQGLVPRNKAFEQVRSSLTRLMLRFLGLAEHFREPGDGNVDMCADVRGRVALIEKLERQCEMVHSSHSRIVRRFHFSPRTLAAPRRFYRVRGESQG